MKIIYKDNVIEALEWLSDYDFQKIAWFDNDQGICMPYNETAWAIFDWSCLHNTIEEGETVFGKEADKALMELEVACDALGYNWAGKEKILLESDEMKIIREMAKRCLKLIDESDPSESTVMFLKLGESQPE